MDKLTKLLLASVIGIAVPTPFADAEEMGRSDEPVADEATTEITWIADFDEATAKAKAEGKDLLVDFTGSDWCVWCHRLDDEVFSTAEFKEYAAANFVTVALDFPNDPEIKAQVPNPERNSELSEKYGVTGFPTVLLMTPDGVVYGKTGYRAGGPEGYIENLSLLRKEGKAELDKANKVIKEWEAATDENRMAVYERVLIAFSEMNPDYMGQRVLGDVVKAAFQFDADNAKGYKMKAAKTLLDAGQGDAEVFAACRELDPENKEGLLEIAVAGEMGNARSEEDLPALIKSVQLVDELGIKDEEIAVELYFNAAYWCWAFTDQPDVARHFALKLEKLKGDDQRVSGFLKDLFDDIGREASTM